MWSPRQLEQPEHGRHLMLVNGFYEGISDPSDTPSRKLREIDVRAYGTWRGFLKPLEQGAIYGSGDHQDERPA
ncbi:hypothetical protein ACTU6V_06250 [Microbacterium sp. A204]|uniref:hypothetical protein n=1 Tax=Microbacterium sp. A204 TaxID=3457321 RepID=UPI003FCF1D04